MKKFLDPNHLPSVPKSYTFPGTEYRIPWNRNTPWHTFYSQVSAFAVANNLPVPSPEVVEDEICSRLANGWCTGEANYRPPAITSPRRCKSCGGW